MIQKLRFFPVMMVAAVMLAMAPASGADASKFTLPPYTTVKLDNGMTLLLLERHQLPLISFNWLLKSGGSICDSPGSEGVAFVTTQLLRQGTKTRTAEQIAEQLDFVGGSVSADASYDYASGSGEFMSKDAALGIEMLADLLRNPVFPKEEMTKLIKQQVDGIAEAKEVPNEVLGRYYRGLLFGPHPYGRPVGGTEKTLAGITQEQVVKFHGAQYVPEQLVLAVVGDFKTADLQEKLTAAFGSWKRGNAALPTITKPEDPAGRRVLLVEKPDATQTFFRLGSVCLPRTSPDWVPLQVVNTLFGGRFTSMINTVLRIDSGLTYGARSGFAPSPVAGEFYIGSFTKNETTGQALDMTLEVLQRLHEKGITAEQLQSSKNYIKGQFGPTVETNDQLAGLITDLAFYGLGPEYVNNYFDLVDGVTLEDAKRLIEKHYPLKNLAVVLIGQGSVIQPVGAKIGGSIQKKVITDPGF